VWRKLPRREALPTLRAHEILRLSVDGAESDREIGGRVGGEHTADCGRGRCARSSDSIASYPHGG